jgi:hypothetical protein
MFSARWRLALCMLGGRRVGPAVPVRDARHVSGGPCVLGGLHAQEAVGAQPALIVAGKTDSAGDWVRLDAGHPYERVGGEL